MTGAIRAEWRKHASGFSIEWYATMVSLQKVKFEATVIDEDLRDQVNQAAATPEDGTQMIKDVLLIEAALKADRVVASMDDLARAHFVKAAKQIERIRTIVWVNPCQDPEQILEWLKHGAKPRAKYQLFPSRR